MKLMTAEIEQKLLEKPLYSTDGQGLNAECIVKYFNPCGAGTWLISEGSKLENGDWELFGFCHIFEWELGYVLLSELESIRLPFGLTIERDLHCKGTLKELAMQCGYIPYDIEDEENEEEMLAYSEFEE